MFSTAQSMYLGSRTGLTIGDIQLFFWASGCPTRRLCPAAETTDGQCALGSPT